MHLANRLKGSRRATRERPFHPPLGPNGRPTRARSGPLDRWSQRTLYGTDDDLVFAHPQSGRPLDRTKLTRRFNAVCVKAGVRSIRFHDLRHTFATRLAASGQPMRTIQEFLGHADSKTTQIYAHYAPGAHEVAMVNAAFAEEETTASGPAQSQLAEDVDPIVRGTPGNAVTTPPKTFQKFQEFLSLCR